MQMFNFMEILKSCRQGYANKIPFYAVIYWRAGWGYANNPVLLAQCFVGSPMNRPWLGRGLGDTPQSLDLPQSFRELLQGSIAHLAFGDTPEVLGTHLKFRDPTPKNPQDP